MPMLDRESLGRLQRGHLLMEEMFRRGFPEGYPEIAEDVSSALVAVAATNTSAKPETMELCARCVLLGALIGVLDTERRIYEASVESRLSCDYDDPPGAGDTDPTA